MGFAKGKTAMFKDTKLVIIRHKRNVWAAYVGNRRLTRFKIKERCYKMPRAEGLPTKMENLFEIVNRKIL